MPTSKRKLKQNLLAKEQEQVGIANLASKLVEDMGVQSSKAVCRTTAFRLEIFLEN
jgi:hypothetical protein